MNRLTLVGLGAAMGSLLLLVRCGSSAADTALAIKAGTINNAAPVTARSVPEDAVQSSTEFSFAKVDGIKITVNSLAIVKAGANDVTVATFPSGKEIEIAPGTANSLPITESAQVDSGTYRAVKVRYPNSYKVKAFCRTATKFVYTTATQIKSVAVGTVAGTLPLDYDYFAYTFADIATATTATGTNGETVSETESTFSVSRQTSSAITILFDPAYSVTCMDGTTVTSTANTINPFSGTNNSGLQATDFFPNNTANFGLGFLPSFVWGTDVPGEAVPTAETYLSSLVAANLSPPLNYKNVNITSMAFRADGTLLDLRSRVSGGTGELNQNYSGISNTGNSYTFSNGEWLCDQGFVNCHAAQDRAVLNFIRTVDYTSTSSSIFGDGTDCGKVCTNGDRPELGNRCRVCTSGQFSMLWKKLLR